MAIRITASSEDRFVRQPAPVVRSRRRLAESAMRYQPAPPPRVRRSLDFSGLWERRGRCWSVEFDADDGVQLDRVRRNPVLAVGKIEKPEPSYSHRF